MKGSKKAQAALGGYRLVLAALLLWVVVYIFLLGFYFRCPFLSFPFAH